MAARAGGQARKTWLLFPCAGGKAKWRAGDEIIRGRVGAGAHERVSISMRLLYMPGHPPRSARGARCASPALSAGWRRSFEALLTQGAQRRGEDRKNAGLTAAPSPPPAWRGFPPVFGLSHKVREEGSGKRDFSGARGPRMGNRSARRPPRSVLSCCGSGRHPRRR